MDVLAIATAAILMCAPLAWHHEVKKPLRWAFFLMSVAVAVIVYRWGNMDATHVTRGYVIAFAACAGSAAGLLLSSVTLLFIDLD